MSPSLVAGGLASPSSSTFWLSAAVRGICPVCRSENAKDRLSDEVLLDARLSFWGKRQTPLEYLRCGDCGSVYAPEAEVPCYESAAGSDDALRHYLEEGAGIDLLIGPLCRVDPQNVRHYAEVGCAFGFSLDFARLCLGWDVRGIDPSPLAASGRQALGLPIDSRYFTEDRPLQLPKADVLQASEVIEHITDPHDFMRGLVASLDQTGILIVSTPNAAALRQGTPDSLLLQVLQPGIHLTLFTTKALVALAKTHGLPHHDVHETAYDVTLYAARQPFVLHGDERSLRQLYVDYLRRRLPHAPPASALRRGLQSRLLKELTLQGRFSEMDAVIAEIVEDYRALGLDLDDPVSLSPCTQAPYNVASVLYCLGMREVIAHNDRCRGIIFLDAAVKWQTSTSASLAVGGVEAASGATSAHIAGWQATTARIALNPAAMHDQHYGQGESVRLSPFHRRQLFAELVNRGDHVRAASHYDDVAATVETLDDFTDEFNDGSPAHRAMTLFTLGILALNHKRDRPGARFWLMRAMDVAERDPTCSGIGSAAAMALQQTSDAELAGVGPTANLSDSKLTDALPSAKRTRFHIGRQLLSRLVRGSRTRKRPANPT